MRSPSRGSRTQPVPSMSACADGSASTANTASGVASIVVDAVTRSVSIPLRRFGGRGLIAVRTSVARRNEIGQDGRVTPVISEWRGAFDNPEINALHAQAFKTRVFDASEW